MTGPHEEAPERETPPDADEVGDDGLTARVPTGPTGPALEDATVAQAPTGPSSALPIFTPNELVAGQFTR